MNRRRALLWVILLCILSACGVADQTEEVTSIPRLQESPIPNTAVPMPPLAEEQNDETLSTPFAATTMATAVTEAGTVTDTPATLLAANAVPTSAAEENEANSHVVTLFTEAGEEVQFILPLPDGIQVLLAHVEAGDYTLPEAVIAALQQYGSEEPSLDLFGDETVTGLDGWRLSSLAAKAYAYATPEEQVEIERLYHKIIPSPEVLDVIAAPAEQSGSLAKSRLARPSAAQTAAECRRLWNEGFPVGEPTLICLRYIEFIEYGHTYRAYYPEERHADEAFLTYVQAAVESLHDSYVYTEN